MASSRVVVRLCQWCGKRLPAGRKAYCNNYCQGMGYRRDAAKAGSGPVPPTQYIRKPRKIIITDEQQREIDLAVRKSHSLELTSRVLRPGDADFDAVAAKCTPPERIPNRYYADIQAVNLYGLAGGAL